MNTSCGPYDDETLPEEWRSASVYVEKSFGDNPIQNLRIFGDRVELANDAKGLCEIPVERAALCIQITVNPVLVFVDIIIFATFVKKLLDRVGIAIRWNDMVVNRSEEDLGRVLDSHRHIIDSMSSACISMDDLCEALQSSGVDSVFIVKHGEEGIAIENEWFYKMSCISEESLTMNLKLDVLDLCGYLNIKLGDWIVGFKPQVTTADNSLVEHAQFMDHLGIPKMAFICSKLPRKLEVNVDGRMESVVLLEFCITSKTRDLFKFYPLRDVTNGKTPTSIMRAFVSFVESSMKGWSQEDIKSCSGCCIKLSIKMLPRYLTQIRRVLMQLFGIVILPLFSQDKVVYLPLDDFQRNASDWISRVKNVNTPRRVLPLKLQTQLIDLLSALGLSTQPIDERGRQIL